MVLPLVKLGTLLLKTVSKPIASRLKQQAAYHPKFRTKIISLAQANHRLTTNIQRRIYGHATDVEIRPLNEEKAVQAAGDLISELFVFSVATAALIFEVQRSARSEAKKEELRKQELEVMRQRDEALAKEVECLKQKLEELEQLAKGKGLAGLTHFGYLSYRLPVEKLARHPRSTRLRTGLIGSMESPDPDNGSSLLSDDDDGDGSYIDI